MKQFSSYTKTGKHLEIVYGGACAKTPAHTLLMPTHTLHWMHRTSTWHCTGNAHSYYFHFRSLHDSCRGILHEILHDSIHVENNTRLSGPYENSIELENFWYHFKSYCIVLAPQAKILVFRDSNWWISFRKSHFEHNFCDANIDYLEVWCLLSWETLKIPTIIFYMSSCRSTWIHIEFLKTVHVESTWVM